MKTMERTTTNETNERVPMPKAARRSWWLLAAVAVLALAGVAERFEEALELGEVPLGHLEAREDAAEVGAVVAVVEQADVPAAAEGVEEPEQGARALREGEAHDSLADGLRRVAADMWRAWSFASSSSARSTVW